MIKKIYDRDTGNIYDVGADNKLKLVAEGTLEWDEGEEAFRTNTPLERGKGYLYILKTPFGEPTFIFTGFCYSNMVFCGTYHESGTLYNISGDNHGLISIYSPEWEVPNLENHLFEIYELPFSM